MAASESQKAKDAPCACSQGNTGVRLASVTPTLKCQEDCHYQKSTVMKASKASNICVLGAEYFLVAMNSSIF
jgi:hypothetical protein